MVKSIENTDFPQINGQFDTQKFVQFNPEDAVNWYLSPDKNGKKKIAMYPVAGRHHIQYQNNNKLYFNNEPRGFFKSKKYSYVVDADVIYIVDKFFNQTPISGTHISTLTENIFFTYLTANGITFACFVDGINIYIYQEDTGLFYVVTDPNAPIGINHHPQYIATFGNRILVSDANTPNFYLSTINLDGGSFDANTCFTINGASLVAQEAGIIQQLAVLHNTLYIFCDFTTGIWSNIPTTLTNPITGTTTTFPWKKNTTYDFNYGMADPLSLAVGFGKLTWLATNEDGLFQVVTSEGGQPKPISTKAINLLFQRNDITGKLSPFQENNANGFMYIQNDTIFYRLSAGLYNDSQILNYPLDGSSIEYNFETDTWQRICELNGQRGRVQRHIYFNDIHLVTVQNDTTVYQLSQQFYTNQITNPNQPDHSLPNAYIDYPFLYSRITPIISENDYAEFITDWLQVDFVWGNKDFYNFLTNNPPNESSIYYENWFKPHLELYFSDDGGVSYNTADVLEFSQNGVYSWRMRWYQLGVSRNRCYKLEGISPAPLVVLGAVMNVRRISGNSA